MKFITLIVGYNVLIIGCNVERHKVVLKGCLERKKDFINIFSYLMAVI